jgi:hypothetical protein
LRESISIYTSAGVLINDPDQSVSYAHNLRLASQWPKGFGPASFTVTRDIAQSWAVRMAYGVKVKDGNTTVYEGQLGPLSKQLRGTSETINVTAAGWYNVLAKRRIHKRWVDNSAVSRLVWNKRNDEQRSFTIDKRENDLLVKMSSGSEISRGASERYEERYDMPAGETVKRVTFNYKRLGGPDKVIEIYNGNGTLEFSVTGAGIPTTLTAADFNLSTPTQRIVIKIGVTGGLYDDLDAVIMEDLTIYSELGTITAKSVIEDILTLVGGEISTNYGDIIEPALVLEPFMSVGDTYVTADSLIGQAVSYGDASLRTYGFSVWDSFGTTDSLPRPELTYRDKSTYQWIAELAEFGTSFEDSESDSELYNYVIVQYKDGSDITRFRTPVDNAALMDTASIARYGRRDSPPLDIGAGDTTRADYLGTRYLAYHKDPLRKTSFTGKGRIRTSQGMWVPINRVRGGQAIKILDYNGGEVFWLTNTDYNAETAEMKMQPDLPPDDLVMLMTQEKDLS